MTKYIFPISGAKQNTQTKNFLLDTRTGILGSIAGPCDFLPARSDEFKKVCINQKPIIS